jgi:hypothetical protein
VVAVAADARARVPVPVVPAPVPAADARNADFSPQFEIQQLTEVRALDKYYW